MGTYNSIKFLLNSTANLGAYYTVIEQREKIIKQFSQTGILSNYLNGLVKYYNFIDNIIKSNEIPLSTTETIKNLLQITPEIYNRYSKYYNQVNRIIDVLNPSLKSFVEKNSRSKIDTTLILKDLDLAFIHSFDVIKEQYNVAAEEEIDDFRKLFETDNEFKSEVTDFIEKGEFELSSNPFEAFSQILEKHISRKVHPVTIALFLNILFLIFQLVIPLKQIKLSNESEERIILKIEQTQDSVINNINQKSDKMIEDLNANASKVIEKLDSVNQKLDSEEDK